MIFSAAETAPAVPDDVASAVLHAAPLGIVVTTEGGATGEPTIVWANPAFVRMSGYAIEEVLGRRARAPEGPPDAPHACSALPVALASDAGQSGESACLRADGETFLVEWSSVVVRGQGGSPGYFVTFQRDVTTERKNEALAETAAVIDTVGFAVASLRHELANPINSVKTALTMLRCGVQHYPIKRLSSTLDQVADELARIRYLFEKLRALSEPEAFHHQLVDVRDYLEAFRVQNVARCAGRQTTLSVHVARDVPRRVRFDDRLLRQALQNLFDNALDAVSSVVSSRGGEPSRASGSSAIDVSVELPRPGWLRLTVTDDGPGIAADELRKIFLPFFTTKASGTGLGLPLVRRLLTQMGGSVDVQSTEGTGTSVVMELPGANEPRPG